MHVLMIESLDIRILSSPPPPFHSRRRLALAEDTQSLYK